MTSIAEPIIDAMPSVEEAMSITLDGLSFRGKTLSEWESFLVFPPIHASMSIAEISKFNIRYVEVNDCVMSNYAIAKASSALAGSTYQSVLKNKQNAIIENIKNDTTKRMPGIDSIEKMATLNCSNEYHAWKISELFVDFWRIYHDKLSLLDSRLSSIGYMMRN